MADPPGHGRVARPRPERAPAPQQPQPQQPQRSADVPARAQELLTMQRTVGNRGVTAYLADAGRPAVQRSMEDLDQAAARTIPGLSPAEARRLRGELGNAGVSMSLFGPRRCLLHLLGEVAAGTATLDRAQLAARSQRYEHLVLARPDGYLATALSGRALQKVGELSMDSGALRAGGYVVGQFYYSSGGVFYNVDAALRGTGPPIGELGLEHTLPDRVLDGIENAVVGMVRGLVQLIRHPIQTIQALAQLPGAVATLIANSPEYWDRFKAMPLGDQVEKISELVTTLALLYGTAAGTTTRLGALAADLADVTIPVLRLEASGALAVAEVTVPVGTVATAMSGGPGAVYILTMANQAAGGSSGSSGGTPPGGQLTAEPGVTLTATEEAAAQHWVSSGKDVRALRPAGSSGVSGVRTADLEVQGVGRVDVYSPEPTTNANNLVRAILAKSDQTSIVHVELVTTAIPEADLLRIPNRVFGHPVAGKNIGRIVVRRGGQVVLDAARR
jgi:hypothetical protein